MKTLALLALLCSPARAFWGHVHVGVSLPLTGDKADRGQSMLHALQMKAEEVNASGGIGGRPLDLEVRDDRNDPATAIGIAREFAADKSVIAVIGHYDDEPALKALPIYNSAHLPVFFPSISNPELLKASSFSFSGTYSDDTSAETLAAYMKLVRGYKNVLIFYGDGPYGRHLVAQFSAKAAKLGINTRAVSYAAGPLPDDFVKTHIGAADKKVDAVVLFAHILQGAPLIKQLRANGVKAPFFGSDRLASNLYETLGSDLTEDIHIAFPFLYDFASIKGIRFREAFEKRFRLTPTPFAAFAYDGLGMIAEAARKKADRGAIREALAAHTAPDTAYDGVAGPLYFDKYGSAVRDTVMGFLRRGQWKPCYTQLRKVTEVHTLSILPEKVKLGEVVVADGVPFFKIQVVYAGVDYYRVNQVNAKDLNFESEFFLWFKWQGDADIENIGFINELPGKGTRTPLRDNLAIVKGDPMAEKWASFKVKGVFVHPYDLKLFPFDTQTLPLLMAHKNKNANKIMLVADTSEESNRKIEEIFPQEWTYLGREDYAATFNFDSNFGNPDYSAGQTQADYSVYQANMVIKRNIFAYVITLFMPLALLMATSLLGLLIPKEQFAPRNGLVMSALLGVLVYHMAEARSLPQVGYLMRSDFYFVIAYVLLFSLVLALNVVNLLLTHHNEAVAAKLDRQLHYIFPIAALAAYAILTVSAFSF